jgi:threonine-phosphate decarboxylase
VKNERALLIDRLKHESGITVVPSDTVFILARLPEDQAASDLKSRLLNQKILIRDCSNFDGLSRGYFRISLKSTEANHNLAEKLIQIFPCDKVQKPTVAPHSIYSIGQANDC